MRHKNFILLNLALVRLAPIEVFSPLILGQKIQLFSVDGTTASITDSINGLIIFHAQLHKGNGYENGCPSQPCDAVNPHTGIWVFSELVFDYVQPPLHNFLARRRAICNTRKNTALKNNEDW